MSFFRKTFDSESVSAATPFNHFRTDWFHTMEMEKFCIIIELSLS